MGLIVDTSVLIGVERGRIALDQVLESFADDRVAIAAITVSELLHGVARAGSPSVEARRLAFCERIVELFPVVPFGLTEARHHAVIWAGMLEAGTPIGSHDTIVGATALARGDAVLTLNQRDFARIPGLRVVGV